MDSMKQTDFMFEMGGERMRERREEREDREIG